MTDWVECEVTITGSVRDISLLKTRLAQPYESFFLNARGAPQRHEETGDFLLWNCARPEPEELLDYWSGRMVLTRRGVLEMEVPRWYQWNMDNWGTKWELGPESAPHLVREGPRVLTYSFASAGQAPLEALQHLSREFPQVRISLDADGFAEAWKGNCLLWGGIMNKQPYLQPSLWSLEELEQNYG